MTTHEPTMRELDAILRRIELEFLRRFDDLTARLDRVVTVDLYDAHRMALTTKVAEQDRQLQRLDERADELESTRVTRAEASEMERGLRGEVAAVRTELADRSKRGLTIWGLVIGAASTVISTGTAVIIAIAR